METTMKLSHASVLCAIGYAALFLTPATYAADSASSELTISGTSPQICQMPDPSATNTGNASYTNAEITVTNLVNPQDATVQSWSASLNYTEVMCNYAAVLSLKSQNGGMTVIGTQTTPVGGQFLTKVDYTATAKWGSLSELVLNTSSDGVEPVSLQTAGANKADLTVDIETDASNIPLLEGQYQDTLIIKVGPSV
jgi:hypothetical protein